MKLKSSAIVMLAASLIVPTFGVFASPNPGLQGARVSHVSKVANAPFFLRGHLSAPTESYKKTALDFLRTNQASLGIANVDTDVQITAVETDELGHVFVTCTQRIHGVPVYASKLVIHFDASGKMTSVSGNFIPDSAVPSTIDETMPVSDAYKAIEDAYAANSIATFLTPETYVLRVDKSVYRVYKIQIQFKASTRPVETVFLDQHSGRIVRTDVERHELGATTGTGKDLFGKTQKINVFQTSASSYQLKDTKTPALGTIVTNTFANSVSTMKPITSTSNAFLANAAAVSAHLQARKVLDFYSNLFGRKGINHAGMDVVIGTNFATKYPNAFWDDQKNRMVIGDGDGYTIGPLAADLGVIAHEFTHGVIQYSGADLAYHNQSGALNESFCDVFGVLIKTYMKYDVANGGYWKMDPSDWVIGEVAYTPYVSGDAIRDLSDPERYEQPEHMAEYVYDPDTAEADFGGVHTNSGIPNQIAYLIAYNIGMEATAKIYYRALTKYMNADTDFYGAGQALYQAAVDLYGASSHEVYSVNYMFKEQGIDLTVPNHPFGEPNNTLAEATPVMNGLDSHGQLSSADDVDVYKFTLNANTLTLNFAQLGDSQYKAELLDSQGNVMMTKTNQKLADFSQYFNAGTYYVRISSSNKQPYDAYSLSLGQAYTQTLSEIIAVPGYSVAMKVGEELPMEMRYSQMEQTRVLTVASSDPQIATYDSTTQNVTAHALGTTVLTAKLDNGMYTTVYVAVVDVPGTSNLRATNRVDTSATVRWNAVPGVTGYEIYVADQQFPNMHLIDAMLIPAYTFRDLTYDAPITVAVRPYLRRGNTIVYGEMSESFALAKMVEAPKALTAKAKSISSIELNWEMGNEVDGYRIYRSTTADSGFKLIQTLNDATYTDTNLKLGATYYYRIQGFYNYGGKEYVSEVVASGPVQPNLATVAFRSTINAAKGIQLTWTTVAGATGYEVYRASSLDGPYSVVSRTTATTYAMTSVPTTASYYFKVRAVRKEASATYAGGDSIVALLPKVTSGLAVKKTNYNALSIGWTAIPGATGYEIYRAPSGSTSFTKVGTSASNAYTLANLTFNSTYAIKVRAYRTIGTTTVYGAYSSVLTGKATVGVAEGNSATPLAYNSVKLNWNKVDGANGYEILRATSASGATTSLGFTSTLTWTDKTVLTGTPYYYSIRAYRTVGASRVYGAKSTAVSVTANLEVSEIVRSNALSETAIQVDWAAVPGASGYEVYGAQGTDTSYTLLASTTALFTKHKGLNAGVTYAYKVRAYRTIAGKKVYGAFSEVTTSMPRAVAQPGFTFDLSTKTVYAATQIVVSMHNQGGLPLRVLSSNTKLIDKNDDSNNRDLSLAYDNKDGYGYTPMEWLEFEPNETATIGFLIEGGFTTYTKDTIIEFEFVYDGVTYIADCSATNGVDLRQK